MLLFNSRACEFLRLLVPAFGVISRIRISPGDYPYQTTGFRYGIAIASSTGSWCFIPRLMAEISKPRLSLPEERGVMTTGGIGGMHD